MAGDQEKRTAVYSDFPEQPFGGDAAAFAGVLLSATDVVWQGSMPAEQPTGPVYRGGTAS